MYVHIGEEVAIQAQSVTAVIDLETVLPGQQSITEFINSEDDLNRLQYLTEDIPRSVIVTTDRTYISSLSVGVIRRRIENKEYF